LAVNGAAVKIVITLVPAPGTAKPVDFDCSTDLC